jgi:hypothetical protein
VGSANFQNQPKTVAVDDVVLRVVPPLELSVEFAGPVTTGTVVKAKIRATRHGEEKAPVAVAFRNLPLGLTAPSEIVISPEVAEIEVELGAAPNSMVGTAPNITVVGTTKVQGKDIRAESAEASLDVTMPQ